ncbi:hypothetical protein Taro_043806 [Colocasia esculenta]|uniref:RNase H type-1 domain-containing protein n=1 Tax=Colocasia esculenta TaxID=4460 RepID=A0A843WWP5_COLES|nr:hypothetical protein [Colocasia esculenta]
MEPQQPLDKASKLSRFIKLENFAEVIVKAPLLVGWIPLVNNYSINVDGACKGNPGACGGGGCFKDINGDFVFGFAYYYRTGNSLIAKTRAIHDGLRLSMERHLNVSVPYSDSAILVRAMTLGRLPHWAVFPWWRGICFMLQTLKPKIVHSFWEGNQVADSLASHEKNSEVKRAQLGVVPGWVTFMGSLPTGTVVGPVCWLGRHKWYQSLV